MKYTIEGFSQIALLELELDCVDAVILRYIANFCYTDKMKKILIKDKEFFVINYATIIQEIPVIKITNKIALAKRFKKYVKVSLMKHYTHKKGGTYSCYRFTDKAEKKLGIKKMEE